MRLVGQLIELLRLTKTFCLFEQIKRRNIESARIVCPQQGFHTRHAALRYRKDGLEAAAKGGAAILRLGEFFSR